MSNKISHTKLNMFLECPQKFNLHYNQGYRAITINSALVFGSALDKALNHLLVNKDLSEAIKIFDKEFTTTKHNGEEIYLPSSELVVYSESDLDEDLINLASVKQKNPKAEWVSLYTKGLIMINSYYEQVLPKIQKVHAVQESSKLENDKGDILEGFLDMVVTLDDGKTYLLDNKTSVIEYKEDAPKMSTQLVGYYHEAKDRFGIDAVGFVVIPKRINKNKTKICKKCGFDGTGTQFKTCNNKVNEVRCKGDWNVVLNPNVTIEILTNEVPQTSEDLVLKTYDSVNEAIKNNQFFPNLSNCYKYNKLCHFAPVCWENKTTGLINIKDKNGSKN